MLLPLILLLGTTVSAYSDFALINASKGFSLNGDGMEARGIQSSFNGKHLHVLPSNFIPTLMVNRNSSGNIISVTGPNAVILKELAHSLHFTFEYIDFDNKIANSLDDKSPLKPGTISLFREKKGDFMVGEFGYNSERNKLIDYPYPTKITALALLIPKPTAQETHYLVAIWQPFQPQVWIYLVASLVIGVISLYYIALGVVKLKSNGNQEIRDDDENKGICDKSINEMTRFRKAFIFIFGLIVVQGSTSNRALGNTRKLIICSLAGAWCLACFVLVTAYSSVLISFLTASETYKPIVNSINDLAIKRNVRLTINKGLIIDINLQNAITDKKGSSIYTFLGEDLKRHPEQRCTATHKCLEQVRKGSSVYAFSELFILNIIGEEWKKTGRCDFTVAKEKFELALSSSFLFQKNSPYTNEFSIQIMRMKEAGLLDVWWKQFAADSSYCLRKIDQEMNNKIKDDKKPLTLKGLSGAFLILCAGCSLAIAVFIVEICCHSRIYEKTLHPAVNIHRSDIHPPFTPTTKNVIISTPEVVATTSAASYIEIVDIEDE